MIKNKINGVVVNKKKKNICIFVSSNGGNYCLLFKGAEGDDRNQYLQINRK